MRTAAIIPARYASTRFPGKPLALINGKPMVQHVYERCTGNFDQVVVATDDECIFNAVLNFGGKAVITSSSHPSGTDRCAEAARMLSESQQIDVVVNVQGDEPFVETAQLKQLLACFENPGNQIATLVTPITNNVVLFDHNKVKVVRSKNGNALYFSRQPIPYLRDVPEKEWLKKQSFYLHLGLYAYRYNVLQQICKLQASELELSEKLEQLRWLENGFNIQTTITDHVNFGVDTPADLEHLLNNINK